MLRVDFIKVNDDASEQMASGIVWHKGKLQHTEGISAVSAVALSDLKNLSMEPLEYMMHMSNYYSGSRMYATEPYLDEDDAYDENGFYIGATAIDSEWDNLPDFDLPEDGLVADRDGIRGKGDGPKGPHDWPSPKLEADIAKSNARKEVIAKREEPELGKWKPMPPPRIFKDDLDAEAFAMARYEEWAAELDEDEKAVCYDYQGSDFMAINSVLRGQEVPDWAASHVIEKFEGEEELDPGEKILEVVGEQVELLDSAIAKTPKVDEPFVVMRGFHHPIEKLGVGDVLEDKGFVSTTFNKAVAETFGPGSTDNATLMFIKVPKGARGAYLKATTGEEENDEQEFLLPRNSRFRVEAIEPRKGGSRHIQVELVL